MFPNLLNSRSQEAEFALIEKSQRAKTKNGDSEVPPIRKVLRILCGSGVRCYFEALVIENVCKNL